MATLSRTRIKKALFKVEGTYGSDPSPAGGTDDVLLINSDDPVRPDFEAIQVRPHGSSFTHTIKDIIGKRKVGVTVSALMQGAGILPVGTAVPAVNGFTGLMALWKAARCTVTAENSDTVHIRPSTIAALQSVYGKIEEDGILWTIAGMYGNMRMSGGPGQPGVLCQFTGTGKYTEPADSTISGFVGPDRSEPFLGVTASITPSLGNAYDPGDGLVLDNFTFDTGTTINDVDDVTEATGLDRLLMTDARPTAQLVIAQDGGNTANLDFDEIYGDLTSRTVHGLSIAWGTTPNRVTLAVPTAQLLNAQPGSKNGYKILTLDYKCQHATAETEWNITIT